ncbi:hypothetical protein CBF56_07640 [Lactobacillus taiwanensis]|nr:DUF2971 domain-containing protein [Lactobacillus taiwanensis]OYS17358.1 hypothetical protein CBF56_07640 [Lactobacillus taiwanensis]
MKFKTIYCNQLLEIPICSKDEDKYKMYFVKQNWDDYGYKTTFSLYFNNRTNYVGDVKLCTKIPQNFEYSMQQYIIDTYISNPEKLKIWMIGANFEFYQKLEEIIKATFLTLQYYYDFLNQMNDLILFPDQLDELESNASPLLQEVIKNSVLRSAIFNYWDLLAVYNCGKIIFSKKFFNFHCTNDSPFLIKNLGYIYNYINEKNVDESKLTSLFNEIVSNIDKSEIYKKFLSSFCAYILIERFFPEEEDLLNRLIFDNTDQLLDDILKKYKDYHNLCKHTQLTKIQIYNSKLYLALESLAEKTNSDSSLFRILIIILGSKEVRDIAQSVNKIMSNLMVKSEYFSSKDKSLLGQYTTIDHLCDLIKPIENKASEESEKPSLRLSNLQQMNDPMEGKVLEECFPMIIEKARYKNNMHETENNDKKINTANSGIFISSATSSLDNLPMWKQYADNASGISLAYKNTYLSKILNNTDVKLYRVCYIVPSIIVDNFKMLEKLIATKEAKENIYNLYISKIEEDDDLDSIIFDINKNLSKIFKNLRTIDYRIKEDKQNIKLNRSDFRRAIKCIRALRYLFKDQYYAYENEFRLVRDLGNDTDGITYDKRRTTDHPVPFLRTYIYERGKKVRVEYDKVILGPKCLDSDYVSPYIKYCNRSLDIYNSDISYR